MKKRNGFVRAAAIRNAGGPMKNKKDKRKNGKNKQVQFLSGNY